MPLFESQADVAIGIMMSQYDTPYGWGGNSILQDSTLDCSGAINAVLLDMGYTKKDNNSRDLAAMFTSVPLGMEQPSDLVFFNRGGQIGHVEMVLAIVNGKVWTIGASGGDSKTTTIEAARKKDARVKINTKAHGWIKVVKPFRD